MTKSERRMVSLKLLPLSSITMIIYLLIFHCDAADPKTDDLTVQQKNKQVALSFLQEFFGDKKMEAADKYLSASKYIQHNPLLPDGKEALKTAAMGWFKGQPATKMDVRRVAADGDLVWIHHKSKWDGGKDVSVVDIFRLEDFKIVEHWDVIMEVPEKSANSNSVF